MELHDEATIKTYAKEAIYSLTITNKVTITDYEGFKQEIESIVYKAYTTGKAQHDNYSTV